MNQLFFSYAKALRNRFLSTAKEMVLTNTEDENIEHCLAHSWHSTNLSSPSLLWSKKAGESVRAMGPLILTSSDLAEHQSHSVFTGAHVLMVKYAYVY